MNNANNKEIEQNSVLGRCLLNYGNFYIFCLLMTAVLGLQVPLAAAAGPVAKFGLVEGKVDVLKGGSLPAAAARTGDEIFERDMIRTKSASTAEIVFNDGAVLMVSPRSRLDISEYVSAEKGNRVLNLPRGKAQAIVPAKVASSLDPSSKSGRFEIRTPNAVAGVRGTCYSVFFGRNITQVFSIDKPECTEPGIVYVYNKKDPETVTNVPPGFGTSVNSDKSATTPGPSGSGMQGAVPGTGIPGAVIPTPPPPSPITGPSKQGNFERID